jgi:hypothetical protein
MLTTWKTRTKDLSLDQLILGTLLVYVNLHLLRVLRQCAPR